MANFAGRDGSGNFGENLEDDVVQGGVEVAGEFGTFSLI